MGTKVVPGGILDSRVVEWARIHLVGMIGSDSEVGSSSSVSNDLESASAQLLQEPGLYVIVNLKWEKKRLHLACLRFSRLALCKYCSFL